MGAKCVTKEIIMDVNVTYYHGSKSEIAAIKNGGMFGGIFATACKQAAMSHGKVLHTVTSQNPLTDYALNYEIDGAWNAALEIADGNEDLAEAMMDADCPDVDGFDGWDVQAKRGELAKKLGFDAIEMRDEHGAVWLCFAKCTIAIA